MSAADVDRGTGLDVFEVLAEGLDHPECVAWDPKRGVLYAGGEAGQIYEITTAGDLKQVGDLGAFVLGLALDGDGRIYACAGSEVVRFDPADGTSDVYTRGTNDEPMRTPNYTAFGPGGDLFVTDSGEWDGATGLVYRVVAGRAEVWSRELVDFPNGCCLSADHDSLLVVQSQDPGLWRIPLQADGSAGSAERLCQLPGSVPDGVAVDAAGRMYVSCYRPDRIYRIAPGGDPEVLAEDPRGVTLASPTNIAFFGSGLERLAAAGLGRWHVAAADLGVAGSPLVYPSVGT